MNNIAVDRETLELLVSAAELLPASDWLLFSSETTTQIAARIKTVTDQLGRDPIFDPEDFT